MQGVFEPTGNWNLKIGSLVASLPPMERRPLDQKNSTKPRYRWPWFLLAAVLLGILLAVLWMSKEIKRIKTYKEGFYRGQAALLNFS